MTPPIHFAFGLDTQEPLDGTAIGDALRDDRLAWVHLDGTHPQARAWLDQTISYLDPFVVDALMADETRPRLTRIGDGALVILRGINHGAEADPEDMVSVRFWIDPHRIISVCLRPVRSVDELADAVRAGRGPRDAAHFLRDLVQHLVANMQATLTKLDDDTDTVEEDLIETGSAHLRADMVRLRKQAILLRRHMAPMRDVILGLQNADLDWLDTRDIRALMEAQNNLTRHIEDLDALRERAQIIKDELVASLSDRLNRQMFILSVISAIFLPLGFITGLLGINVGGMPGADTPSAFWITCAGLAAVALAIVLVLRRFRWF